MIDLMNKGVDSTPAASTKLGEVPDYLRQSKLREFLGFPPPPVLHPLIFNSPDWPVHGHAVVTSHGYVLQKYSDELIVSDDSGMHLFGCGGLSTNPQDAEGAQR